LHLENWIAKAKNETSFSEKYRRKAMKGFDLDLSLLQAKVWSNGMDFWKCKLLIGRQLQDQGGTDNGQHIEHTVAIG
ncbi:hypothetical protein, partial [Paenibacillus algorifonticola]|uniref:hypothetical protein n=1 Tax=Paenibacillus algorifonticola TaxID=684063 RepID=UPI0018CF11F7